jgi:C-terminal processing protease CtpA/Prc
MKSALRNAVILGSLAISGCYETTDLHQNEKPKSAVTRLNEVLENQSTDVRSAVDAVLHERDRTISRLRGAEAFVGIGIGLIEKDGVVVINNVFLGSPAEQAGLVVGDIFATVDGTDATQLSVNQIFEILSSEKARKNGSVKVSVVRDRNIIDVDVGVKHMRFAPRIEIIDQE